jgi:hypothetical protein
MAGSLPGLIDLYEAHKKDREKFEVLAFHDGTVKDFAELDKKLETPRKSYWGGRDLPFPILLDATGQTIKDWGVRAFPTTLLIDPDGKLVGEAGEEQLEGKLPPLPAAVRVARALDRNVPVNLDDATLDAGTAWLARVARLPIRLDRASLKQAGVTPETRVPLKVVGMLSLRSALGLFLEAEGLTYEPDGKGLVIRGPKPGAPRPKDTSDFQRNCARRIEKALDEKVSFDFKDKPLAEVAQFFEKLTKENFVLDPVARKAGRLDLKTPVSGSAKDVPLREALQKLVGPAGMTFTVRDEVVVLTAKPKAPEK